MRVRFQNRFGEPIEMDLDLFLQVGEEEIVGRLMAHLVEREFITLGDACVIAGIKVEKLELLR